MNAAELTLLTNKQLSPQARSLYIALRSLADAKGIVQATVPRLIELTEYEPPLKSRDKGHSSTPKQIRVLLERLEAHQLIQKVAKGVVKTGAPAVYLLPNAAQTNRGKYVGQGQGQAENQQPRGLEPQQGQDEGQVCGARVGQGQGQGQRQAQTQQNQGMQAEQGQGQGQGQGQVLNKLNKKNKYIYGPEQNLTAEDIANLPVPTTPDQLELDSEFQDIATLAGCGSLTPQQLQALFIKFQTHRNNAYLAATRAEWLTKWRGWCANQVMFGLPNQHKANGETNHAKHEYRNGKNGKTTAADILKRIREAAEQATVSGEGSGFE
jgi:hypothetical protein